MRRFIAGAVCPECRAVDRVVVEDGVDGRRRRCVACGHSATLVETFTPEPATRLTTRANADTPAQPIRLMVPASPHPEESAEGPAE